ncbi:MAG: uroporphyrinogen decarboxylase [bacterium]
MNNSSKLKNDLLLKACRKQPIPRTPVWIMRQAGRYLPEYQKVRAKADFKTMCHTAELAAEVTLQPVDILGVDAAIIFSDILVVPEAMGMDLNFIEGQGPVFEKPLRDPKDFEKLQPVIVEDKLGFVLEALRHVRKELVGRVPLIGFAGAPWTLAAYMVEGHGSKHFSNIKSLMYTYPNLLKSLLEKLSITVADFLSAQIKAGAQVVQIFDSLVGILAPEDFRSFSLPYLQRVLQNIKRNGEPVIMFARGAGHSIEALAEIGAEVLSVSWTEDLGVARKRVRNKVALQGNLDPCALFAPAGRIREEVLKVLRQAANGSGHIFNLGHGILPQTPVEHAQAMVDFVKEESPRFHNI